MVGDSKTGTSSDKSKVQKAVCSFREKLWMSSLKTLMSILVRTFTSKEIVSMNYFISKKDGS